MYQCPTSEIQVDLDWSDLTGKASSQGSSLHTRWQWQSAALAYCKVLNERCSIGIHKYLSSLLLTWLHAAQILLHSINK